MVSDFNLDGKPDLVTTDFDSVYVLLGKGDGDFGPLTNDGTVLLYEAGGFFPFSVAVADFNRDGKPDVAALGVASGGSILFGDGTGRFGPAATFPAAIDPRRIAASDLNLDGKLDLI